MKTVWQRKEWTTPGPDPTLVVEWTFGPLRLTEFQGIYQWEGFAKGFSEEHAKQLHQGLEEWHDSRQAVGGEDRLFYGGR